MDRMISSYSRYFLINGMHIHADIYKGNQKSPRERLNVSSLDETLDTAKDQVAFLQFIELVVPFLDIGLNPRIRTQPNDCPFSNIHLIHSILHICDSS